MDLYRAEPLRLSFACGRRGGQRRDGGKAVIFGNLQRGREEKDEP